MNGQAGRAGVLLTALVGTLVVSTEARGQGLSVDVSAGRVIYDPVIANVGTNDVIGTVRYDARRGAWVSATAAPPLRRDDHIWGVFGTGGRFLPSGSASRRVTGGLDVAAQGFLFRDAIVEGTGSGATIGLMPFVGVSSGVAKLELRGGWRGHTLSYAGSTEHRGVYEAGARVIYEAAVRMEADARWVRASEGAYPFLGGTVSYGGRPVQAWVQAGRWLSTDLADLAWSGGAGVALGSQATVWASVRREAPDPLYWNVARRGWTVGITRQFGRRGTRVLLPSSRSATDGVVVRVPTSDVPGTALSIAGDFNNWQPVPMHREQGEWVIRLPLAPGVYHYAFRSDSGDWFVPASVIGRRSDGMGGHLAVLVVT